MTAEQPTVNTFDAKEHDAESKRIKEVKKQNLSAVFGSGMGRVSLVVFFLVMGVLLVLGFYKLSAKPPAAKSSVTESSLPPTPTQADSDLLASSDEEASRRRQHNAELADSAAKSGSGLIAPPVIKADPDQPLNTGPGFSLSAEEKRAAAANANRAATSQTQNEDVRIQAMYEELKKLRNDLKEKEVVPQMLSVLGKDPNNPGGKETTYVSGSYGLPDRTQKVAQNSPTQSTTAQRGVSEVADAAAPTTKKRIFEAGDACYASPDFRVNTDNPGTEVVSTLYKCKGIEGKLIGRYELRDQYITYSFDKLSIPGFGSVEVKAIAINEDTWDRGLADDVDNHYFKRFAGTAFASLLTGLGRAAQIPVGTTTTVGFGSTTQSTTTQSPMTVDRQAKIALGEVGVNIGQQFQQMANNTRPTVKVGSGADKNPKGIGIVFLNDVYLDTAKNK